ncbi:hypothetical protein [Mycobacterium sp. IDR2000157661]|uniref:hypothetical protein n=1 Tax=Mycobacterium sp. IDR2000157661 TaxID=2867005 RepID=UPI001EED1F74|nr:hypothetical protein [Mycobacterium sp. IDR2000157661]ULE34993.1 hypothetical protein K3G64_10725 [Mycobacterium sp. IDR2000157661]
MTEPTSSSAESVTDPAATTPPPAPPAHVQTRGSRLTTVAAWVGIVAGVVFIVAVVFFSGFILGKNADGQRGGGHRGDHDSAFFHRGGPPMFPMGPRADVMRPPSGAPGMQPPQSPQSPSAPTTTTTPRP